MCWARYHQRKCLSGNYHKNTPMYGDGYEQAFPLQQIHQYSRTENQSLRQHMKNTKSCLEGSRKQSSSLDRFDSRRMNYERDSTKIIRGNWRGRGCWWKILDKITPSVIGRLVFSSIKKERSWMVKGKSYATARGVPMDPKY